MKKYFNRALVMIAMSISLIGCNRDKVDPTLNTFDITEYDLIQITNANTKLLVSISVADDKALDKVEVSATKEGGTEPVAKNTVSSITANDLGKFTVDLPFPLPEKAPSGLYTIKYVVTDKSGKTTSKSYKVNLINNRTKTVDPCTFNNPTLPADKNVWLNITVPSNTTNDVYIVGSFMSSNGASGDWNPKNPSFKLEKVSDYCFRIALKLTAGQLIKFTSPPSSVPDNDGGAWDYVMKNADGNDYTGDGFTASDGNMEYGKGSFTGSTINFTIANWRDRVQPSPVLIPAGAIKTGMATVLVDVNTTDDSKPFYLVKKGATAVSGANKMLRMTGTKQMAIAVPREAGAEYVVYRDNINTPGQHDFGYDKIITIDTQTNPIREVVSGFKNEFTPQVIPTELHLTGDGAPAGWVNNPPSNQTFANLGSDKFEIASIALSANKSIKFLVTYASWNPQISQATVSADKLSGTLKKEWDPASTPTPSVAGNYKITIDFRAGTYKLTKL